MDSLSFIIPAYNDAQTIETVLKRTIDVGNRLGVSYDVFVVNDKSTDTTGQILEHVTRRNPNIRVITHTKNAGYGRTIKELYQKADNTWLFSLPGDYQIEPGELVTLWGHRYEADMIIGWRSKRNDNPRRLRQSKIYNTILTFLFGLSIHDVNSVRLMRTSIMQSVRLTSSSAFVDAELVIRAGRAGFRIIEIPIAHRARAGMGASGGKLTTIIPTIRDMIRFWL